MLIRNYLQVHSILQFVK